MTVCIVTEIYQEPSWFIFLDQDFLSIYRNHPRAIMISIFRSGLYLFAEIYQEPSWFLFLDQNCLSIYRNLLRDILISIFRSWLFIYLQKSTKSHLDFNDCSYNNILDSQCCLCCCVVISPDAVISCCGSGMCLIV